VHYISLKVDAKRTKRRTLQLIAKAAIFVVRFSAFFQREENDAVYTENQSKPLGSLFLGSCLLKAKTQRSQVEHQTQRWEGKERVKLAV
jgi:hypothetical protein